MPAAHPVSCVGYQVTNSPIIVIEVETFDLSDFPFEAVQFVTV
jgi:hypothetical protein